MPQQQQITAADVFAVIDRSYEGVRKVHFLNNGAGSRLVVLPIEGEEKQLPQPVRERLLRSLVDAARNAARCQYGDRSLWPVHLVFERPDQPGAG